MHRYIASEPEQEFQKNAAVENVIFVYNDCSFENTAKK